MTAFQRKRLDFFIKAAEKNEWVHLGKGDIEVIKTLMDYNNKNYDNGFQDGRSAELNRQYEDG